MKLIDTNILIYSVNTSAAQHARAKAWLEETMTNDVAGFAWNALLGFLRIATRPGIFPRPLSTQDALATLENWLTAPTAQVLHPSAAHAGILGRLLLASPFAGNLVSDAHLAALAIEHHAELATFDRDFLRFPGLRVELLDTSAA